MRKADLSGAYLLWANLRGQTDVRASYMIETKGWTKEQVLAAQAVSLEGATMPNGQKYEDWLNDKESRGGD
jgi:hypothetical protein